MFADFQKVGKEHCCIDILKSFVGEEVIALAVSLSIGAGILSEPVALVVSSCMRKCKTSSSEHRSSSGQEME